MKFGWLISSCHCSSFTGIPAGDVEASLAIARIAATRSFTAAHGAE